MTKVPNLFLLMKEQNITQKQLAEKLSISQGNISDWKTGRCKPSYDVLSQLAKMFDTSIDYLEGKTDIRKPMTQDNISEEDNKILTMYHQLPKELQEKYMKDLELLLKLSNTQ